MVKDAAKEVSPPKKKKKQKDREAAKEQKAKDAALKDKCGLPIPKRLKDVFGEQMIPMAMAQLNHLMKALQSSGRTWAKFVILDKAIKGLNDALAAIEAGNPYAVHPACEGAGCNGCRGCGYVPKWRMEELKGQDSWKA